MRQISRAIALVCALSAACALAGTAAASPSPPSLAETTGPASAPDAAPPARAGGAAPGRVPGQVIVGFAAGSTAAQRRQTLRAIDPRDNESIRGVPGARLLTLEPGETVAAALARLRARPDVAYAEPNRLLRVQEIPNDPRFGFQWGLRNVGQDVYNEEVVPPWFATPGVDIRAERAWDISTGGGGRIAVVDTGVDPGHPDLAANLEHGLSRNFVPPPYDKEAPTDPADWADVHGHGTHVAGILGAVGNNGLGVAGVDWRARIVAVRVCRQDGNCPTSSVAEGLAYAGQAGIPVANVSLGFSGDGAPDDVELLRAAIAAHPGTLYVVAAGNGDKDGKGFDVDLTPEYPCALELENVLCVAALEPNGALTTFSNWGARSVDLGAPGRFVESTYVRSRQPLYDDFEDGLGKWTVTPSDPDVWGWAFSPANELHWMLLNARVSPQPLHASAETAEPLDLRDLRGCWLSYRLGPELTGKQRFLLRAESDAKDVVLAEFGPGSVPPDLPHQAAYLDEIEGEDNVRLVFEYVGDPDVADSKAGRAVVTAVELSCLEPTAPGGTYTSLSGTSMAAPMVAGVASLGRSVAPGIRATELKRAIMETATPSPALSGRTVTGGRADAAALLGRLRPTPAPAPAPTPPKPRLGKLRLTPANPAARPGRAAVVRARIANTGTEAARGLRICLRAPKRLLAGGRCTSPRRLGPGRTARATFRLRPTKQAAPGQTIRLRAEATARSLPKRRAAGALRIRQRAAPDLRNT